MYRAFLFFFFRLYDSLYNFSDGKFLLNISEAEADGEGEVKYKKNLFNRYNEIFAGFFFYFLLFEFCEAFYLNWIDGIFYYLTGNAFNGKFFFFFFQIAGWKMHFFLFVFRTNDEFIDVRRRKLKILPLLTVFLNTFVTSNWNAEETQILKSLKWKPERKKGSCN